MLTHKESLDLLLDPSFELEEVGNECGMVYTCDVCGDCEYHDDGGHTTIYRVGSLDVCQYCVTRKPRE